MTRKRLQKPYVSRDRAEARRQQIVEAAFRRFSRRGVRGTALLDICREARLSVNTLYRTFGSKEEIVAAVAEESRRRDLDLIGKLLENAAGKSEQATTLFSAERLAHLGSQEETRVRIELWAEALYDPALAKIVRRGMDDTVRSIELALGERENGSDSRKTPLGEAHALAFLWNGSSPWRTLSDISCRTGQQSQRG